MNNKVGIIGAGHVGSHCAFIAYLTGILEKSIKSININIF